MKSTMGANEINQKDRIIELSFEWRDLDGDFRYCGGVSTFGGVISRSSGVWTGWLMWSGIGQPGGRSAPHSASCTKPLHDWTRDKNNIRRECALSWEFIMTAVWSPWGY